eukprot:m.127038 g.127038  ORF g.127038 m.127038 type:complete len:308 (-) comp13849_c0_seq7:674-1597(-)
MKGGREVTPAGVFEQVLAQSRHSFLEHEAETRVLEVLRILGVRVSKHEDAFRWAGRALYGVCAWVIGGEYLGQEFTGTSIVTKQGLAPNVAKRLLSAVVLASPQFLQTWLRKLVANYEWGGALYDIVQPILEQATVLVTLITRGAWSMPVWLTLLGLKQVWKSKLDAHMMPTVGTGSTDHTRLLAAVLGVGIALRGLRSLLKVKQLIHTHRTMQGLKRRVQPQSSSHESTQQGGSTVQHPDLIAPSNSQTSNGTCLLCLDALSAPSALPCGHVFCWECIQTSLSSQEQCPNCRRAATQSVVIQLHIP